MATVERVSPEGLERKKKAIEASMKLRQNSSVRGVLTMWVAICYGAYLLVGLQLLVNAIFGYVELTGGFFTVVCPAAEASSVFCCCD